MNEQLHNQITEQQILMIESRKSQVKREADPINVPSAYGSNNDRISDYMRHEEAVRSFV